MSTGNILLVGILIFCAAFTAGYFTHALSTSEEIETLKASRDWWRDRALGKQKPGHYASNPPEFSK